MKIKNQSKKNILLDTNSAYKFYHDPIPYTKKDYQEVLEEVISRYSSFSNVRAIYQIGGQISTPGISDLDIVIALDDQSEERNGLDISILKQLDERGRYLFCHKPFFIKRIFLKHLAKFYPIFRIKHIYGDKINLQLSGTKTMNAFDFLTLIEICTDSYPWIYIEPLLSKKIDVRRSLAFLKALKYPVQLCTKLTGKPDAKWDNFIHDTGQLCENWFYLSNINKHQKLLNLLKDAIYVSMNVIDKLSLYMIDNFLECKSENDFNKNFVGKFIYNGLRRIFTSNFDPYQNVREMIYLKFRYNIQVSILPYSFMAPLVAYSKENGQISNHISKHLYYVKEDCKFILNAAKSRINLINQNVNFLEKLGLTPYKVYAYGYLSNMKMKNYKKYLICKASTIKSRIVLSLLYERSVV